MTAGWHGTPDGPVWGVKARVLPKGEYDAEDEQVDGVQEEEMIDGGTEEIRAGQSDIKFNSLANDVAFPNTVYQQLHRMTRAMCGNAGGRQPWCLLGRS